MSMNLVIKVKTNHGWHFVDIPQTTTEMTKQVLGGELRTLEGAEALEAVFRYLSLRSEERQKEIQELWKLFNSGKLNARDFALDGAEVDARYHGQAYELLFAVRDCPHQDELVVTFE